MIEEFAHEPWSVISEEEVPNGVGFCRTINVLKY